MARADVEGGDEGEDEGGRGAVFGKEARVFFAELGGGRLLLFVAAAAAAAAAATKEGRRRGGASACGSSRGEGAAIEREGDINVDNARVGLIDDVGDPHGGIFGSAGIEDIEEVVTHVLLHVPSNPHRRGLGRGGPQQLHLPQENPSAPIKLHALDRTIEIQHHLGHIPTAGWHVGRSKEGLRGHLIESIAGGVPNQVDRAQELARAHEGRGGENGVVVGGVGVGGGGQE